MVWNDYRATGQHRGSVGASTELVTRGDNWEDSVGIGAADIGLISMTVVSLTQLTKYAIPQDGYGPYVSGLLSLLGVYLWSVSHYQSWIIQIGMVFDFLSAFAIVWTAAAGVYGLAKMATSTTGGVQTTATINTTITEPVRHTAESERPLVAAPAVVSSQESTVADSRPATVDSAGAFPEAPRLPINERVG